MQMYDDRLIKIRGEFELERIVPAETDSRPLKHSHGEPTEGHPGNTREDLQSTT